MVVLLVEQLKGMEKEGTGNLTTEIVLLSAIGVSIVAKGCSFRRIRMQREEMSSHDLARESGVSAQSYYRLGNTSLPVRPNSIKQPLSI